MLALVFRIAMLFGLTVLGRLRTPLVTILGNEITWRDVILIGGGLFLIAKAVFEIHGDIDVEESESQATRVARAPIFFWSSCRSR